MKKILCISGSTREKSSNKILLQAIQKTFADFEFKQSIGLEKLGIFRPSEKSNDAVATFVNEIEWADTVLISTPEYIHNIPAVLKNALEWITEIGVLDSKNTIAVTFTPHAPRGEHALQSLLFSLEALNARVIAAENLYRNEVAYTEDGKLTEDYAYFFRAVLALT